MRIPAILAFALALTAAVFSQQRPNRDREEESERTKKSVLDEKQTAKDIDLAKYDAKIKPADRKHWAYLPVSRPAVPVVRDTAWVRNPIDAFVLAKLEKERWKPAPEVEARTLLRRVYLDLTGMPPTLAEQDAFLALSPAAYDKLIQALLSRPSYGERWGRHWLDLVRYAETNGYERDAARPFVWRYRDYVIQSFNDDKPFDRFILEQLAGDELPDSSADTLIATGYYRLGPWDDEPADPLEDRYDQLDDIINTTSLVFLGLTMGCARCHDHKFEALTMHDYYRLAAVFNGLSRPTKGRTELVLPAGTKKELADASRSKDLPRGYFMREASAKIPDMHLLLRGKAARPGPKVAPGLPTVLVKEQPPFPPPGPETSLRRLTLARWIASPDNPLTARVIVNRVWQYHFGEGLVRTPSDFGVMGQPPTHSELLDWLAGWFVEQGWSVKKLHRLIMSSSTYRMSKRWHKEYAAHDPDNNHLWRFPYKRLEVEAMRDSMLAVSGRLNAKMFGPSMYPFVPKEALEGNSDPEKIWKPFDEKEASRRTIYAHIKRPMIVPFLETLDLCDTTRSADKRLTTTVAPQALTLFNGDFVNRQARYFAERVAHEVGENADKQIERAYRLALCRPPSAKERQALRRFFELEANALEREGKLTPPLARQRALERMCRVIFNLNEFVYPD